jgi:hypothetical protein
MKSTLSAGALILSVAEARGCITSTEAPSVLASGFVQPKGGTKPWQSVLPKAKGVYRFMPSLRHEADLPNGQNKKSAYADFLFRLRTDLPGW